MCMADAAKATALVLLAALAAPASPAEPTRAVISTQLIAPRLGQPLSAADIAAADLTIFPDGRGLPPGRGIAIDGAALFKQHCAACHGEGGRGATAEELAGGTEPLTSRTPDKTIGLYWPYTTTIFDFIRRSMPMHAPGSLTADQVYALTAYLLQANGLIGERDEINATTLPRVRMPNRDGFVGIDAQANRPGR